MLNIEKTRQSIRSELALWDQPSISVGIVKDGEILLNEGFGLADVSAGRAADADTLYQIGSCSKSFTAAAAALLADRGLLEWDKPVVEYLPWLRFKDDFVTMNATTRDMLCHRTGLPRHDAYWIDGPVTRRGMAENLRNMQPGWSFRSHWCYQNTCYVAVGMLIEELSGMTWEEFIKKEFLEPLGMDRTTFYVDAISADPNGTVPYERPLPTDISGFRPCPFLKSDREDMANGIGAPYGPAGSIMSTVNDMLKWLSFHLNNGLADGRQIVSEENMKELHKPQMLLSEPLLAPFPHQDFFSYGLGWFTETHRGHLMVEHGGNINGFSALMTLVPDQNLGIVTLTNFNNSFDTYATAFQIVDDCLDADDVNWNQYFRDLIAEVMKSHPAQMEALSGKPVEGTAPSHALADYTGTYTNACYGDIEISLKDGGLEFLYNKDGGPLAHFHYDAFQIRNPQALLSDMVVYFHTGKNGSVESLSIGIALNPEIPDEVFVKKAAE